VVKKSNVGLDIGCSAVRAAQVVVDGKRATLTRFAQVGLPAGAVAEGEIQDPAVVAAALKRLWAGGKFASNRVVVGVSSQRAMVRQVEMPPMSDGELRAALRFKIGEFLPIPVEQAVVDFAPLADTEGGGGSRRLLLVAAQRDVVREQFDTVRAAGLQVEAVDSSALALLRAVSPHRGGGDGGLQAVISVGAQLITVAVREQGVPRFFRTVGGGPEAVPEMSVTPGSSQEAPAGARSPARTQPTAARLPGAQTFEGIASEVRSSLEYFLTQSKADRYESVVLTGGGSLQAGLAEALSAAVGVPVSTPEASVAVDAKSIGLEQQALAEASVRWMTAVGLALWGTDEFGKPSLVPAEVYAQQRQRRAIQGTAAALSVIALLLGGVYYNQTRTAQRVNSQLASSNSQAANLSQSIAKLGYVVELPGEVARRRLLAQEALQGDIDWPGLLARIRAAIPPNVKVVTIQLTKAEGATSTGTAAPTAGPSPTTVAVVGAIALTVTTGGGAQAVSQFIRQVSAVRGLQALWVSSTSEAAGMANVQATAQVTSEAFSSRAANLPGGAK
jgi:type IV pilus assembly protein PilM